MKIDKKTKLRFWKKVKKNKKCWTWRACKSITGYGEFCFKNKMIAAHRFSWIMFYKKTIAKGKFILHRCDNPPCVRPSHLFLGTAKDNALDTAKKGRNGMHTHPEKICRGEKHGMAILSSKDVRYIRSQRLGPKHSKKQKMTLKELAKRFGVSYNTICQIAHKRIWKHV